MTTGARKLKERWERARERWWVRWGVDLLLFALLFAGVTAWQTRKLPGAGTPAPDFTLRTLSGETVRLEDLRGKSVALTFWAPWCTVCKAESSTLSTLRDTVGERAHVLTVAVAYDTVADVQRFVRERGADYPVLLGDDALQEAYRVDSFPTTIFLSPEGRVTHAAVGYTTRLGFLWRLWL
ncbi:peroxiredoxin family protein [Corallococcus exercitus]|uniref:peroxiredoxin family protein n=1 Tax=Corallococcus exercitus TaxID=2316736 RepID=UPI0035D50532